jgi:hypothetical protein
MIRSNRSISTANMAKPGGYSKRRLLAIPMMLFLSAGCGKGPQADALLELAASFEDSPAKEDVIKSKAAYEQRRYKDSLKRLHAVLGRSDLTGRQKSEESNQPPVLSANSSS